MKKIEILKRCETENYLLHKHYRGIRRVRKWLYNYEKENIEPHVYEFERIELTVQFLNDYFEYKINKKDYKYLTQKQNEKIQHEKKTT